jgi:hypothetical protein
MLGFACLSRVRIFFAAIEKSNSHVGKFSNELDEMAADPPIQSQQQWMNAGKAADRRISVPACTSI